MRQRDGCRGPSVRPALVHGEKPLPFRPLHAWRGIVAAVGLAGLASPLAAQMPTSLSETYEAWTVRCERVEETRRCWMIQSLARQEGERVLQLEFAVVEGETTLAMVAPFGLLLGAGADFTIDGTAVETLGFRTCLPLGCIVRAEPDDALLAALRRGNMLTVGFEIAATGEPFALELSLSGFTAAHNRLRALAREPDQ